MTNNEKFGSEALPLASMEADDGTLRFKVIGEDGRPLVAELPINRADAASLKGFARYGGFKLRFEFLRTTVP